MLLSDCVHTEQAKKLFKVYLTIRQLGLVVYEQIVDEGETRVLV